MHIAVLMAQTDVSDFARSYADDGEKFIALLRPLRPDWRFSNFSVITDEFPDDITKFDGVIITGSMASANDPDPWVARLIDLIQTADKAKTPMFGACFGHQIIAHALGGTVGSNPQGWVFGAVSSHILTACPWHGNPSLYAAHQEQVLKMPDGAVVVASAPDTPVAAFTKGKHIATTQYHPEISPDFFAALQVQLANYLPKDVVENASVTPVDQTDFAEGIARFFEAAKLG